MGILEFFIKKNSKKEIVEINENNIKSLLINENNGVKLCELLKKHKNITLKKKGYEYYIDELREILEERLNKKKKNDVDIERNILFEIKNNVDWDNFKYSRAEEFSLYLEDNYKQFSDFGRYLIIILHSELMGKNSYDFLIKIINSDEKTELRGKAMKLISMISKQNFDRNLPKDTGRWKETDLRINELNEWIKKGFPDGKGYKMPNQDSALNNPKTELELSVSKLNDKLKKYQDTKDLSSYNNFLVISNPQKTKKLVQRYKIKGDYLEFLKRFSPCNVIVSKGRNEIELYGVDNLEERQIGYSTSTDGLKLEGWPENYLVIADRFADPYCIDLSKNNSEIYYAHHGMGEWKFQKKYDSFIEFIDYLGK